MNKRYNLKLDLQFRCNNSIMKFNQFDNSTSDFFMRITNAGKIVDIEKAIVVLAVIKPSGKVSSQFVEVENGLVYADLKPSMKDEIGTYTAKAMLILEDERVVTDVVSYEVEEDKIFSLLNDTVGTTEEFTMLTDMLSRLSTIEISEEQRMINEAERILSEENRKIEEAKRVEAELIRQHEEADRTKYDAIRESNENIRKQNESIRLSNESNRIDEEAKRVEEENKRKLAEEERNANYNFMTEDEERRRSEANAHKEAEILRVQVETIRVNEEAKRRTTEQGRVSAENIRVNNENTREANEIARQNNESQRVEAETQRQNRYNSFIADAEANVNNFENYTNNAKVKEEERKSNELDRKSQEDRRLSNELERISNENIRKANEEVREKNETSRQNAFTNKVSEVDKKILEVDKAESDITTTVSNKINEVETRFNRLTSQQQQSSEVIDARDGETSLKARLDRDIEKANKELDKIKKLEESTVSTVTTESDFTTVEATSNGYFEDVKLEGKTLVNYLSDGVGKVELVQDVSRNMNKDYYLTKYELNTDYYIIFPNFTPSSTSMLPGIIGGFVNGDWLNRVNFKGDSSGVYKIRIDDREPSFFRIYVEKGTSDYRLSFNGAMLIPCSEITYEQALELACFNGLMSVGQSASEDGADEIVVSSVNSDNTKADKKRLLYYNEETQSWEKPVLREWDSIEKHADGKYYYHVRSAEVVLNGSENWSISSNTDVNGLYYSQCSDYISLMTNVNYLICNALQFRQDTTEDKVSMDTTNHGIMLTADKSIRIKNSSCTSLDSFKQWLQANNVTIVYQLAQEKVYECTNIDLITYANETNYIVNSGAIVPRTTLKVHNNISNVVSLLQKKVSLLESNVKASQEVQDMMILETDMRMLDIELALMDFIPMKLNLGGSDMLRSATYFNFLKNHIINETYEKEYLENVMNKYLATGRINQDEYNELYKMLYPPVYDIELPIEY